MKLASLPLTGVVSALALIACSPNPPPSSPEPNKPAVLVPAMPAASSDDPEASGPEPSPPADPTHAAEPAESARIPVVGCTPFEPVKSQDPCSSPSDCAPSSPCHARACVAAANAPPRPKDVQCTMNLVCNSLDVGRCDCVDGVCALVSR